MSAAPPKVAVVIPVRNGEGHLGACLDSIVPQAEAHGGHVIVVDDGSSDSSVAVAGRWGARVLSRPGNGGPYVARNEGWTATDAPTVVFTDVRCRANAGWLGAMVEALAADGVAIAGGDVIMRGSATVAQRWAERDQRLRVLRHTEREFLPFVPTASLVVRRSTLEKLDGFRPVRSGGDVDLCWRAQLAGLGTVIAAPGASMDCEPRRSTRAVLAQWRRYGEAHAHLWSEFAPHGCPFPPPPALVPAIGAGVRWTAGAALKRRDPVEALDSVRHLVYQLSYRRACAAVAAGQPWR